VKKSVPASSAKWVRMKTDHGVVRLRSGAGGSRSVAEHCQPSDRNHIPKIGNGARDPVVAPVPVLARHTNDQLLHLALEPRSARTLTSLRAGEFTGDQPAVPGFAASATFFICAAPLDALSASLSRSCTGSSVAMALTG
jgi:hypothetical protein